MDLPRFYRPELGAGPATLSPEESHHAAQVLRLRPGAALELFDGCGQLAQATVVAVHRRGLTVDVGPVHSAPAPAGRRLTLCTALPRAPRQAFLFEKCTELGVGGLLPTTYARSVVQAESGSLDKWRRKTVEAAKQCGCVWLPTISPPATLAASLAVVGAGPQSDVSAIAAHRVESAAQPCVAAETQPRVGVATLRLVASPAVAVESLGQVLRAHPADVALAIWIGPEGGLTAEELAALGAAGVQPVGLGPHILRVETAALAVAAAVTLLG